MQSTPGACWDFLCFQRLGYDGQGGARTTNIMWDWNTHASQAPKLALVGTNMARISDSDLHAHAHAVGAAPTAAHMKLNRHKSEHVLFVSCPDV